MFSILNLPVAISVATKSFERGEMTTPSRVALFIDAENTSSKDASRVIEICRKHGKLSISRCYGGAASLKKWEKANAEHHIVPMLTLPSATKANAGDFAMTIDAVSLLHRGLFDQAVIASSDADFTQLAIHIREHGKGVHGIGETKAPKSLQTACDSFVELNQRPSTAAKANAPPAPAAKKVKVLAPSPKPQILNAQLEQTFKAMSADGPVSLGQFGKRFKLDHPQIDLGKGKLKKTLVAAGFEVDDKQTIKPAA
jgi:NYN domain